MKKYKLIKDLPTFKAGDEFVLRNGDLYCINQQAPEAIVLAYPSTTLEKFPNIIKDWFEEISEEPKTVWDLKDGDNFWKICEGCHNGANLLYAQHDYWSDSYEEARNIGDVFLTREEGDKELARRKAKQILLRDTKRFKPDWKSTGQSKYEVYYSYSNSELRVINYFDYASHADLWFRNLRDAEQSILHHAKEWKIYLGVEDE